MKTTLLTESLGSGGAERQICTLAVEMKRRGVDVRVVTYRPGDFYLPLLESGNVPHCHALGKGLVGRILAVRRALRSEPQDAVLSFMRGPSYYALLAGWPRRKWRLVVSERSAVPGGQRQRRDWTRRILLYADGVTTNSHTNRLIVEQFVPRLAGRVVTIYNAVDLNRFRPASSAERPGSPLRLLAAASYTKNKNMLGLIEAMALLQREPPSLDVSVDWYGACHRDRLPYEEASRRIAELGLKERVRLNRATPDILSEYQKADAVILPSFYEGLPNVVCEAMACGCPILMSAVCDAGNLVKEGENGYLFDPGSPRSIADSIRALGSLPASQRASLGKTSRAMAERTFDVATITDKYLEILAAAARRKPGRPEHWLPDVPETALAFLREDAAPSRAPGRQ